MSKIEALEAEIKNLPRHEALELHDWLAEYLESELELKPEFIASIERGKKEIQAGQTRVRKPL